MQQPPFGGGGGGYGPPPGGGGGWGPPPGGGAPPPGGGPPPGGFGGPPGGGYGPPPGGGYGGAPPPGAPPFANQFPAPPPIQPPQRSGGSGTTIVLIIAAVVAVLGLGTCGVCVSLGALSGSSKPAKSNASVYVFCEGSPHDGFTCSVSHTGGTQSANACWDINVTCTNGARVHGHACQSVSVGAKTTRYVGPNELSNAYACSRLQTVTVDNVSAN